MHLTMPFWSLYILHLGGSLSTLALFGIISGFCNILFQPLLGYLSDKIGRKKPVVWGGFIVAFAPFLHAMATQWVWLIPGIIVSALNSGLWSTRQALFADSADVEQRGAAFATFFTIMSLPAIFMPAIGGILLDQIGMDLGMRLGLIYRGSVMLIQSFANAKFLREDKKPPAQKAQSIQASSHRWRRLSSSSVKRFIKELFDPLIGNKKLQVMMIGQSVASFSMGLIGRFTIIYVVDYIGLSNTEWGLIRSVTGLINTCARIPLGRVANKYGRRICILISYVARPLYTILFFHSQNFTQVLILDSINTLLMDLGMPAWEALMIDVTPSSKRGRLYGTFNMIGGWGVS